MPSRLVPAAALALAALVAACAGDAPGHPSATTSEGSAVRAIELVTNLDRPVYATAVPGDRERLYVVEQPGVVRIVERGVVAAEPLIDIRALVRTSPAGEAASEEGLLSIAFPADHPSSGRFYLAYTDRRGRLVIAAYPEPARTLLTVPKDEPRHMGGQLQIGPDGSLYASVGDDSLAYEHAQRLSAGDVRGKILRLDLDGDWSVVAHGLRNPWRFSFDGRVLWVGDVGEAAWEEIDAVSLAAATDRSANLGWPAYEGFEERDGPRPRGELVWPVALYSHRDGCAVVGGYVYRGSGIPSLRGRYVYGDYCTGTIWSLDPAEPTEIRRELELGTTISSFGLDGDGELLVVSRTGRLFRLADAGD